MAGNKVGLVDVIGTLDGLIAETKVGNSNTTGLFRVILEVCLNIFVGVVTDNFNRVFVSTNGTVTAKTPEFAFNGAFCCGVGSGFLFERKAGNIIVDTNGELRLRSILLKFIIYSKDA